MKYPRQPHVCIQKWGKTEGEGYGEGWKLRLTTIIASLPNMGSDLANFTKDVKNM